MKQIAALFALMQLVLYAGPVWAQDAGSAADKVYGNGRTVVTESWIEEWDPATGLWVRVVDEDATLTPVAEIHTAARYAQPSVPRGTGAMLAQYGPFVVTSATSAAMVGSTDIASPAHFDAMLRDFPQLTMLEMIEAPGTSHDIANLAVGRRIREAGISTHVPNGGSVRSGAVELFLAGSTRTMEQGAQFAVHSWLDNHGREADDFASDHSAHRLYIDYYVEMGMSEDHARDFYAMTNSVPHFSALWLDAADMRLWIQSDRAPALRAPALRIAAAQPEFLIDVTPVVTAPMTVAVFDLQVGAQLAVVPEFEGPVLDYLDLSTTNLAQLDLGSIG